MLKLKILFAALVCCAFSAFAKADAPAAKEFSPLVDCENALKKHCSHIERKPETFGELEACMSKHGLADICHARRGKSASTAERKRAERKEKRDQLERNCSQEIQKFCSAKRKVGQRANGRKCLREHLEELSDPCRKTLDESFKPAFGF